jgi:hypothetical protein
MVAVVYWDGRIWYFMVLQSLTILKIETHLKMDEILTITVITGLNVPFFNPLLMLR